MGTLRRVSAVITSDGSGDATVYTVPVNGFLDNVFMDYGTLATGADLTITEEDTGRALLTITNAGTSDPTWRPRIGAVPVANTAGGTLIPGGTTTGGDGIAQYRLAVIGRIKIVCAQGGDTLTSTLYFDIVR